MVNTETGSSPREKVVGMFPWSQSSTGSQNSNTNSITNRSVLELLNFAYQIFPKISIYFLQWITAYLYIL